MTDHESHVHFRGASAWAPLRRAPPGAGVPASAGHVAVAVRAASVRRTQGHTDVRLATHRTKASSLGRDPAVLLGRRVHRRVPSLRPLDAGGTPTPHVTPRMSPDVSNVPDKQSHAQLRSTTRLGGCIQAFTFTSFRECPVGDPSLGGGGTVL